MVNETLRKAEEPKVRSLLRGGQIGVLNIALLFATAAIAFSLVVTPMVSGSVERETLAFQPDEIDMMSTGSIPKSENGKRYTIRRSVLQKTPGSVCIVNGYGPEMGSAC